MKSYLNGLEMRYVQETLMDGEEVVSEGKFHWFYTFAYVLFLIVMALFGLLLMAVGHEPDMSGVRNTGIGFITFGVLMFFIGMIRKWTTEIAITNKRVVYKRGWIFRNTDEISLNRLEEINLRQGILGRILGYGKLRLGGTGIGEIKLPDIAKPLEFRKTVQQAQQG